MGSRVSFSGSRLRRSENIVSRQQGEELLLVPIRSDVADVDGFLFLLPNEIAVRIWDHLEEEVSFEMLLDRIVDEYEVEPDTASVDLDGFLGQLDSIGAIQIREAIA